MDERKIKLTIYAQLYQSSFFKESIIVFLSFNLKEKKHAANTDKIYVITMANIFLQDILLLQNLTRT